MCRSTNRQLEPEVYFRIVHSAQVAQNGAPVSAYREQTIEITLGPKEAFENGKGVALTRRAPADRIISVIPPARIKMIPLKEPRTPRVVTLLRNAIEWQALLESGQIANQAEIARREGITRARVTQIMGLLRLAPEIQQRLLTMPKIIGGSMITARSLRPITHVINLEAQIDAFHAILRSR